MSDRIEIKVRQDDIEPFWTKFPFLLRFPFRPGPLIFLGVIGVASAFVGLVLGVFGLLFKGMLAYLGLRYAFNVLDLFAKGRFEGESVDHSLWGGGETRPGKFALVLALFVGVAIALGNVAVQSRLKSDTRAQDLVIDQYKKEYAEQIAARERDYQAFAKRAGLDTPPAATPGAEPGDAESEAEEPAESAASNPAEAAAAPDPGPSRADMLRGREPAFGDPLWVRLLPAWYWAVMVLLSFLLPAAAMVVALEDAFFKALNPMWVGHFLRAMGPAYFALWALVLLLAGTRQWVLSIGADWPTVLRLPVEMGLAAYLSMVLFASIGYALYQFHQELHLDVDVDFDLHRRAGGAEKIARAGSAGAAVRAGGPQDPMERRVQDLLGAGQMQDAIGVVKDAMRFDRLDPDLNTRLHQLYRRAGDTATTLGHGPTWITALARAERYKEAVAALRELRQLDPQFAVTQADSIVPMAREAERQGDRELAVALLHGFDKRHPDHPEPPLAYFLGARLMSEHGRQHDKAARLLRGLIQRYPDHPELGEMKAYLIALERIPGSAR